jgi:hypothetical protein
MNSDYFLEAHYYSGGLRHRAYSPSKERPDWAPAADSVGFNDEFPLERGVAAIEVRRTDHEGQRLTWLAVYYPSVDDKLGARSNHAGVGVWLKELTIIDARNLIHGLDLLSSKLAGTVDADALETSAQDFLSNKFLGAYVAPLDDYPGFAGLKFGRTKLAETKLSYLKTASEPGDCPALGDYVAALLFGAAANTHGSRELIYVSLHEPPSADRAIFHEVDEDEDSLANFIRAWPEVTKELVESRKHAEQRLVALETEVDGLRSELSDYGEMKERFRKFETDPLSAVLDEVRSLGRKIDTMSSRAEYVRQPIPSGIHLGPVRRNPVARQRPVEEPTHGDDGWIFLGLLGLLLAGVVGSLIYLFLRYGF